ncbi:A24 family peptidase [Salsuginibacillus kocurii]|uniref:A24 family peptidase n=1 Tax=Salsuginibacillus kocurii TaxID=427078 RepID=UPI00036A82D0|nr:prepilin peptidase [Salsuginibacillus kocurii]
MFIDIVLLLLLAICVVTDVRNRKIYNKVVYPGLLFAFIFHTIQAGWEGISHSFLGFLLGFGLLLIPYLMGGMGAGDVKLLAMVGAFKGAAFVFYTFIYMAIIGAVIALAIILFRRGFLKSLIYKFSSMKSGVKYSAGLSKQSLSATYPYGVAIAGGAMISLFAEGVWFL